MKGTWFRLAACCLLGLLMPFSLPGTGGAADSGAGAGASFAPNSAADAGTGGAGIRKRIMVFGDSNSFGFVRLSPGLAGRLPLNVAWPGRMAELLGPGYEVLVEGLNGRTARTGRPYLPVALASHMPLDMVIIMLGTNDLARGQRESLEDIAARLAELASVVTRAEWQRGTPFAAPRALMICPPRLDLTPQLLARSEALPGVLRPLAEAAGALFFDAATVVPCAQAEDRVHLTPDNHAALAGAVAREVKRAFGDI